MRGVVIVLCVAFVAALLWLVPFADGPGPGELPVTEPLAKGASGAASTAAPSRDERSAVSRESAGVGGDRRPQLGLRGRTVDAAGAPLAAVAVWVSAGDVLVEGLTGFDGRFDLAVDLADDGAILRVIARAPGRRSVERALGKVPAARRGEVIEVGDLVLRAGATLDGQVVTAGGEGVPHAVVVLRHAAQAEAGWTRAAGRTAADGRFVVAAGAPLPAGRWNVGVYGGGVLSWQPRFTDVPGHGAVDLRIEAEVGPAISGRVVDTRGRPIEGVLVTAAERDRPMRSSALPQPSSDAEGRFLIRPLGHVDVTAPVRLVAATSAWRIVDPVERRDRASRATVAWGGGEVEMVLTDRPSLTVVARDGAGEVLGSYGVSLAASQGAVRRRWTDRPADGRVRLPALDPGAYWLRVLPDGGGGVASAPRRVELGPDSDLTVDVRLPVAEPFEVTVTATDGTPWSGCTVELVEVGRGSLPGATDALPTLLRPSSRDVVPPWVAARVRTGVDGRASLWLPAGGAPCVRISGNVAPRVVPIVAAARARGGMDVVASAGGAVVGQVEPASVAGAVYRGMTVALRGEGGARIPTERGAKIAADGTFRFERVPAGAWRAVLVVRTVELVHPPAQVTVSDGAEVTVTIDASSLRPARLEGELIGTDVPAAGRVELRAKGLARTGHLVQLADGRFAVDALLPGEYEIVVTAAAGRIATDPASLQVSAGARLGVTLRIVE